MKASRKESGMFKMRKVGRVCNETVREGEEEEGMLWKDCAICDAEEEQVAHKAYFLCQKDLW